MRLKKINYSNKLAGHGPSLPDAAPDPHLASELVCPDQNTQGFVFVSLNANSSSHLCFRFLVCPDKVVDICALCTNMALSVLGGYAVTRRWVGSRSLDLECTGSLPWAAMTESETRVETSLD